MIREAERKDMMGLLALGRRFHASSPVSCPFDRDSFLMTVGRMIGGDPHCILLVDEREDQITGMLGAVLYPCWFNRHQLIAQELFWWSDYPAELRAVLEEKAKELEAAFVVMQALENERKPSMTRLYRRHGYAPMEQSFIKEL